MEEIAQLFDGPDASVAQVMPVISEKPAVSLADADKELARKAAV